MEYVFLSILSLLVVLKFGEIGCAECPEIYQRFNEHHSYCYDRNSSCNIVQAFPSQQEINQILELHNSFRSVMATQQEQSMFLPAAADMMQMEWDSELAAVAQKYVERCIYEHDCSNCRRVRNFGVGQNIAIQKLTGHNLTPPKPDWSFAIGDWFEEIVYFSKDMIHPFPASNGGGGEYKHFTQLIWAETFRIGCGYTMYKQGNSYTRLYICDYGPAGNIYGKSVYKQGQACSQCPQNTCCGDYCTTGGSTYPGLCKRTDDNAPVKPVTQPTLFYCDFQNPDKEDCLLDAYGGNDWYVVPALGGNFLETVQYAGQNSTVVFSKTIKPSSKQLCVQIKYRKGPNKEKNRDNNIANEIFVIPSLNDYAYTQTLPTYPMPARMQFSSYNMTLQWDEETHMKISFSVPFGADPQFINIGSIIAVDNACSN